MKAVVIRQQTFTTYIGDHSKRVIRVGTEVEVIKQGEGNEFVHVKLAGHTPLILMVSDALKLRA